MENNPSPSEDQNNSSESWRDKTKVWFQENLRMVISIVVVVAIAGGIYAYSKRTQAPEIKKEIAREEQEGEGKISVIGGEAEKEEAVKEEVEKVGEKTEKEVEKVEEEVNEEIERPAKEEPKAEAEKVAEAEKPISQETEKLFIETAVKGDGSTKLARRALANYLEKNPDSSLSAEHKIYIEDYMRRQVKDGRLKIGESREFSKDMISEAIEKSKSLTESQLKNLEKYSQRVPELK